MQVKEISLKEIWTNSAIYAGTTRGHIIEDDDDIEDHERD